MRFSKRLQQRPNRFTPKFPSRLPVGFRSGEPRCFLIFQLLKHERGIHALQSVILCCLRQRSPRRSQAIHVKSITQSRSNGHLPPSGFMGVGSSPTALGVGTGLEPATTRLTIWGSNLLS
ncbi:hypothetical protein [Gimesia aquarii]|uniref:hypothetical protein n=1 Tax=Gimesia aquarii TaxID=2527964 RepID=UPI0018D9B14A|nr:hypothetical protein [Gimesia aquarii]